MTELLSKAFEKAEKLPKKIQDEIGRNLLKEIAGGPQWDETGKTRGRSSQPADPELTRQAREASVLLTDELNRLDAGQRQDPVTLQGFENRAESLLADDPAEAHRLLGAVAAFRQDVREMHDHYWNALRHAPGDPLIFHNYSQSLGRLGFLTDALRYAELACESAPDSPEYLAGLIRATSDLGHMFRCRRLITRWNRSAETGHPLSDVIGKAVKVMEAYEIADRDAEQIHGMAARFLRERDVSVHQRLYKIMGRKGSEWIWCGYELDINDERLLIELQYQFSRQSHAVPSKITEPFDIEFLFEGSAPTMISDEEIEMQIAEYEKQYGMTSEEFMRQMREGTAPDEFETMSWMISLRTLQDEYSDILKPGIRRRS